MKKFIAAMALAIGLISTGSVAMAKHACKDDFDKFCAGKVVCGKGACHACLNAHMADLSKECSAKMAKWDEKEEDALSKEALNKK